LAKDQDDGTILVNLGAHRVVGLLPDRAADSFSEYSRQHPKIVTVSHDRCGIYAESAALGHRRADCQPYAIVRKTSENLK